MTGGGYGSGGAGVQPMSAARQHRLLGALAYCAVALVAVVAVAAGQVNGLAVDRDVLRFLVDHRGDLSVTLFRAVSHLGDPLVLVVLAIASIALLARRHPFAQAAAPAVALLGAAIMEAVAKQVIGRPRPPAVSRLLTETDPSFPSGHATGTAALAMAVALIAAPTLRTRAARITLIAGAALLAAVVGLARMVLGVHWLSDVAAGWLLGTAWAIGVVLLVPVVAAGRAPRRVRPTPSPEPVQAGAARRSSGGGA